VVGGSRSGGAALLISRPTASGIQVSQSPIFPDENPGQVARSVRLVSAGRLSSKGVGYLEQPIVNPWILRCCFMVGDVVIAILRTHGLMFVTVDLQLSGIHCSSVADEKRLNLVPGSEVPLKSDRGKGFTDRPLSPAGLNDCPGVSGRTADSHECIAKTRGSSDTGWGLGEGWRVADRRRGRFIDGLVNNRIAFQRYGEQLATVLPTHVAVQEEAPVIADADVEQPAVGRRAQQDMAGVSGISGEDAIAIAPRKGAVFEAGLGGGDRRREGQKRKKRKADEKRRAKEIRGLLHWNCLFLNPDFEGSEQLYFCFDCEIKLTGVFHVFIRRRLCQPEPPPFSR